MPRLFQVLDTLPKGPTGKILKRAIDTDAVRAASAAAPRGDRVMNVDGKVAIVTGGARRDRRGARRARWPRRARAWSSPTSTATAPRRSPTSIGDRTRAVGAGADVSSTDALRTLIALAETAFGPVDLFCANAGIGGAQGLADDDGDWDRAFQVNMMAHVRAARLLLPGWLERGSGLLRRRPRAPPAC